MTIASTAAAKPPYVFISYARGDNYDRHLASQLDEALRVRKIGVFRDQSSIEVGAEWPDELAKALARATHFVVILSAESEKSAWVNLEIDAAVARPREELHIVGIRRSTSATFHQLEHIQVRLCDVGEELDTVFHALGLPWIQNGRVPTSSRLRNSRPQSRMESQLCDREDAETTFREWYVHFLRAQPWTPQAHFIVGREDEQHDSLVERLAWTYLEDEAKALMQGREPVPVHVARIDWPKPWTVARNRDALVASVFDTFFARYSRGAAPDIAPRAFARKMAELAPSVVALVHTIPEKRWGEQTPKLLGEYLRFWREVGRCDERRLFFLFFNIEVCHPQAEDGQSKCVKCEPVYVAIARMAAAALRPKAAGIPATLLPLHCVKQSEVLRWFDDREDALAAQVDAVCARLFASGNCQPMVSVEQALRGVQIAHLREAS